MFIVVPKVIQSGVLQNEMFYVHFVDIHKIACKMFIYGLIFKM